MKVKLAVLADFANVTAEGKLNIIGMFDTVAANAFPVVHPQMQLILVLEAAWVERGRSQTVEIVLDDPDGKRLIHLSAAVAVGDGPPGEPIESRQILTLANLRFEAPGTFQFTVFVNNNPDAQVPLRIVQREGDLQGRFPGT